VGKYIHRVAISNHRIIDVKDDRVIFKWKDYKDSGTMKTMSLRVEEFMRIRFYGILSNRNKKEMLAKCRGLFDKTLDKHESGGQNLVEL